MSQLKQEELATGKETAKAREIAWLTLWLAASGVFLRTSGQVADIISTVTPWQRVTIENLINLAGVSLLIITIVLALLRLIFVRLPRFLTQFYSFQVVSAKIILSPVVRLILTLSELGIGWINRILSIIGRACRSLVRRVTLALLRSCGIEPAALLEWIEVAKRKTDELKYRVAGLEANPIVDDFSLRVLGALEDKRDYRPVWVLKSESLLRPGLDENELVEMLNLGNEEIHKLRSALLRLYGLQMVEPIYVEDKITWWRTPHGGYFLHVLDQTP